MVIDRDEGPSTGGDQLDSEPDGPSLLHDQIQSISLHASSPLSETRALRSDEALHADDVSMPGKMSLISGDDFEESLSSKRRSCECHCVMCLIS